MSPTVGTRFEQPSQKVAGSFSYTRLGQDTESIRRHDVPQQCKCHRRRIESDAWEERSDAHYADVGKVVS